MYKWSTEFLCIEYTFLSETDLGIIVRLSVGRVFYFYLFCNDRGNVKNIEECAVHTIPETVIITVLVTSLSFWDDLANSILIHNVKCKESGDYS